MPEMTGVQLYEYVPSLKRTMLPGGNRRSLSRREC